MNTIIIYIALFIIIALTLYIFFCIITINVHLSNIVESNKNIVKDLVNVLNLCTNILNTSKKQADINEQICKICAKLHADIVSNTLFIKQNMIRRKVPIKD